MTAPRLLRTELLYQGWNRLLRAVIRLSDGVEITREVEDHGQAAAVLPYDPERRVALLVRLLRPGPLVAGDEEARLLEAPAGIIEDEDAEATARREAMEEAGVRLGALEPLGAPYPSPGMSTERIALFLAPYTAADRLAAGGGVPEEHEGIEVVEMPLARLWGLLEAGELSDLKTVALTLALRVRRPQLFG